MKATTILTIFGLAGMGAAQSSSSAPAPATVTVVPTTVIPRTTSTTSSSRTRRTTTSSRVTTTTASAPRSATTSSSALVPSVITTVVNQFVTICVEPTTFYVYDVCYTATSAYQPVTVTNCPCTVEAPCPTPYVAPTGIVTGYLALPQPPAPVATAGAVGVAPAPNAPAVVSSAGAAGATAYAAATNTKYVTAGSSKPTLVVGLMSFLMSLPLLAALLL